MQCSAAIPPADRKNSCSHIRPFQIYHFSMALNGNKENVASSLQEPFARIKTGKIDAEFNNRNLQDKTKKDFDSCKNNENNNYSFKQRETTKPGDLEQATSLRPSQQRRALGDITNKDKRQPGQAHAQENLKQKTTNSTVQKNSGAMVVPRLNPEDIEYMPKESVQDYISPEIEINMDTLKESVQKWKTQPFCYLSNRKNDAAFSEPDDFSIQLEEYDEPVERNESSWSIHSEEDLLPVFSLPKVEVMDMDRYKCT
jgi:hypothetical protein